MIKTDIQIKVKEQGHFQSSTGNAHNHYKYYLSP